MNVWFFEKSRKHEPDKDNGHPTELEHKIQFLDKLKGFLHPEPGFLLLFLGITMLLFGSYIFSESLLLLAKMTGLSDIIIGLTFAAIAPTIPNIASGIQGTIKGYTSIAIVETFSSNILTILITLGILAIFAPIEISAKWISFDIPAMILISAMLMFFILKSKVIHEKAVLRYEGALLIIAYVAFIGISIFLFR
jgi:cation:H+ antiporter